MRILRAASSIREATARSQCPEEAALRKEVAERLGYNPFFVWAERTIVARIEREGPAFVATVQLLDAKGIVQGSRSLGSSSNDCAEVAKSVALVISIGIDPELADRKAPQEPRAGPVGADSNAPTAGEPSPFDRATRSRAGRAQANALDATHRARGGSGRVAGGRTWHRAFLLA